MSCQSLLQAHSAPWQRATVHPFLTACCDGTIRPEQFNTWLVQDYLFVKEFARFVGRVLAAAPDAHLDAILSGLGALRDELMWFEVKAAERGLDLVVPAQSTCRQYCEFMASLATYPYGVQAVAFWAIEYAYNQGWQRPGPMSDPYREFAQRWGSPEFTAYVEILERQADSALSQFPALMPQAKAAFLRVAELEAAFWQMAYTPDA